MVHFHFSLFSVVFPTDYLLEAHVNLVPCPIEVDHVEEKNFCAKSETSGGCPADTGAPLHREQQVSLGLVTQGIPSCE